MPELRRGIVWEKKWQKKCEPGAKILLARAAIGNKEVIEELAKEKTL